MATTSQDTGGLGLLQQLMQSGFPPQLLIHLLMQPGSPLQPPQPQKESDQQTPSPNPQGPQQPETPVGNATGDIAFAAPGAVTGIGNMSPGQAAAAFGQGALSGIPGVGLAQNVIGAINQGTLTGPQAAQMGAQGLNLVTSLMHFNPVSLAVKSGVKGLINMARAAEASMPSHPQTFQEAWTEMKQNFKDMTLRSALGLGPKAPDEFTVPTVPPEFNFEQDPQQQFDVPTIAPEFNFEAEDQGDTGTPGGVSGISDSSGGQSGSPAGDASSSGEGDN